MKEWKIFMEGRGADAPSLLEQFRRQGISLSAACHGKGTCGRCRVRFLEGASAPSLEDRRIFTKGELLEGWRLACRAYPKGECAVALEEEPVLLTQKGISGRPGFLKEEKGTHFRKEEQAADSPEEGYGIAVDLGTTVIAMEMISLGDGRKAGTYTARNEQGIYGADIVSRIEASNGGAGEELQKLLQEGICKGIDALAGDDRRSIRRLMIGANVPLVHLLMGYSCETLGAYPFTPVSLKTIRLTCEELLGETGMEAEAVICPGISAYVGGDITAGMYALELDRRREPSVFMDLGTNGEMALVLERGILAASVPAGPAFEGTNGACGSDALGILWELRRRGILDETGRLEEPYFTEGFPVSQDGARRISQKEIRDLQLAKAAMRAGLETLIEEAKIPYEEMERLYLAGGFGGGLDLEGAVEIGLFPEACREKIEPVGNACLKGLLKALRDPGALERMEAIAERAREIPLSGSRKFQEFYMEYMGLEP